jgi:hypothetical protein
MRGRYLGITLERFDEIKCVLPILSTDKLIVDHVLAKSFLRDHGIGIIILGKKNPVRPIG